MDFYMQNKTYQRHGLKKKVGTRKRIKTKTILIRDTDTPDNLDVTPNQVLHKNSQEGILGFADHYLITLDGKRHIGRDVDAYGFNVDNFTVSILMVGREKFTQHQIESLKLLIAELNKKYGLLNINNKTTIRKI